LKVYDFGGHKSVWGGDCGRYEAGRYDGPRQTDYFSVRQQYFKEALEEKGISLVEIASKSSGTMPTVGIPLALHSLEWGIFWSHLFSELGFTVLLSPRTNNKIVLTGVESMTAETCFPVKVFHGHVHYLLNLAEYLFLPNVINMPTPQDRETGFFCPLVESSQYMVRAALNICEQRMIRPTLYLKDGPGHLADPILQSLPKALRPSPKELQRAVQKAWDRQIEFRKRLLERGRKVMEEASPDEPLWIITGRSYNLYDERSNLQLGRHLAKLGIKALPMDYIDVDAEDLSDFPMMYWGLGARILRTAKLIARMPNWYGVHLTNFSCGADSFIEHFYRHILKGKPSLILELDEHSAVAGLLTRIEAYQNVVKNLQEKSLNQYTDAETACEALCQ
jgi:predicted nucleotide-binding protein (sugar kinase/HSP70/actin superfamily)